MADHLTTSENSSHDLVVGLGLSGFAMARYLGSRGRNVTAVDLDVTRTKEANTLEIMGVRVVLGPHPQELFDQADTIFVSPGIAQDIPQIQQAVSRGMKISGELDLFAAYNTTPVVAVTGTNGKTTTTFLIADMLRESGKEVFTGGNIGVPLMEYLMAGEQNADVVVAEVSSFQLDVARKFSPDVGVLLNIAEDHLDRYPDFGGYARSKWSLFDRQTKEDVAVVNAILDVHKQSLGSSVMEFGWENQNDQNQTYARITDQGIFFQGRGFPENEEETKFLIKDFPLLELRHNRENVAAAALAALSAGATFAGIHKAVSHFTLPAHRLALVREINQVRFYNDSKATNIHAVLSALNCFEFASGTPGILLILGGKEKGLDFSPLLPAVQKKVREILAIGQAAAHIAEIFSGICPVELCKTMKQAVQKAARKALPNEVVLLSPACASFDMYRNYQERGQDFTDLVLSL